MTHFQMTLDQASSLGDLVQGIFNTKDGLVEVSDVPSFRDPESGITTTLQLHSEGNIYVRSGTTYYYIGYDGFYGPNPVARQSLIPEDDDGEPFTDY